MGREGPRNTDRNAVRPLAAWCTAVLTCIFLSGCGYTFATTPLAEKYTTIAVPAFKNATFEEDLQIRFNNILVRKLEADGRLRVVNDPATADLVLSGALTAYNPHAISLIKNDDISQYKITIVAAASLEDVRTGEIVWRDEEVRGFDFYQTQGGRTRQEAIDDALEQLAERIIFEAYDSSW